MRWSNCAGLSSHPRRSGARRRVDRLCALATHPRRAAVCVRSRSLHAQLSGERPASAAGALVARVPLLAPRVAVLVIAQLLPEAELLLVQQLDAANPLRRLPEVEV